MKTVTVRLTVTERDQLAILEAYFGMSAPQILRCGVAMLQGMYAVETAGKPKGQRGPKRGSQWNRVKWATASAHGDE